MLELDLRALARGPRHIEATIALEDGDEAPEAGVEFTSPPRVEADAVFTGDRGVHVTGVVGATAVQPCRRCLNDVQTALEVKLDLYFDPGVAKEEEEGQVYALEADAAALDLKPAVREQLLLEVPSFPLCREDCEGLCPQCGVDLNEETCGCVLDEPDPRWDVLRELQADS